MSASRPSSSRNITFQLPRRSLLIAGIAFCVGLLLFVAVWLGTRNNDFYRPGPTQTPQQVAEVEPLPEPLPAGADVSDMPDARPLPEDQRPQLVETPAPAPAPAAEAPAPLPETGTAAAPVPGDRPLPLPGQSPAPRYPAAALRRGERGTVVVRVDVDANGAPGGVTLVQRSGSRTLDRAAMEAVRGWRFQPAQRNGQPVAGSVEIPFDFSPGQ
ncbi:energy transducer TonB [Flavobacterium sp. MXW15]|uniref:Energy transducer TonB n=1 Tax=Xanthomonas chitinilytica TaxID=2989819 RepID=A0ABT3JY58_9XANT|nr:energy transducer TonB [Xanthomonas sp. H13-6]MCW4455502.1 energy transducer TonB [Flavobacterium sp. MXW15]MCW4473417.1 energy transducer TonB [Xanthomonas sp. H13-6]